ncbi:MAG: cobyrinate a,c-diamide synthase [Desulfomonile tiedjei]|nr:cobyrinate a,c-diamide synthase [Desulfomonile tiedjei]
MISSCPRIVVAGAHSGVGKTSVTLGLVAALRQRGLRVQAFKVGPDYLDPTYLALASGRPCYNVDGWMTGREYIRRLFIHASADADIAVIEGVMGLFDGADSDTLAGSTAEAALWLDAEVLLVVNVHGLARSIAALVKGYAEFEPELKLGGVIANHCGSERHGTGLAEALASSRLPELVGAVPRGALPRLPSRHLGLVTADGTLLDATILNGLGDALERHASVDRIIEKAGSAGELKEAGPLWKPRVSERSVKIGLAYDRAFHFYYPDNLEALEAYGCELVHFSPLSDEALPTELDAIYLGGGYPEEFAEPLAGNATMLDSVRRFAESGKPVYAECGGLMYLSEGIETLDRKRHKLVGLLPAATRMLDRLKSLGYVEVTLARDSLFGIKGSQLRGHEFHYSELTGDPTVEGEWTASYRAVHRRSDAAVAEGFQRGNVLASYFHLHFASRPEAVEHLVAVCRGQR